MEISNKLAKGLWFDIAKYGMAHHDVKFLAFPDRTREIDIIIGWAELAKNQKNTFIKWN